MTLSHLRKQLIGKRKLLIMAANEFVQNLEEEVEVQFDIISILSENGKFTLEYIDDAFGKH